MRLPLLNVLLALCHLSICKDVSPSDELIPVIDIKIPHEISDPTTQDSTTETTESIASSYDKDIADKEKFHRQRTFVENWLLADVTEDKSESEPYDGWYNNPAQPSFGSVDSTLIRLLPLAYEDDVYQPTKILGANPFDISDEIMKENLSCENCNVSCSKSGKNVLMAFFGQLVVEEILYSRKPSCPPEYFNIKIPEDHYFSKSNLKEMPFIRTSYNKLSGNSPNNPREQQNSATSWIDGSVIYGTSKVWSEALRSFKDGQLASSDPDEKLYPAINDDYLPLIIPTFPRDYSSLQHDVSSFKLGNPLGHENPFILSFNILFFRWHNLLAETLCKKIRNWGDEECFNEARKWVIATLQNIIANEWVPELLSEELEEYKRYDPSVDPGISHVFQSAAMRYGQTLVPSAVYRRTSVNTCETDNVRVCNSYYNAKENVQKHGIDALLLGMAFQAAEKDDAAIVNDLRRYLYGPLEFSPRDLMAINIQRGRDHGIPGYGIARKVMLPEENIKTLSFQDMAEKCNPAYKSIIKSTLKKFYASGDDVDLWVGGLLETQDGPGPVFKAIIKEQFQRIRDGDRFWFENRNNGLFTDQQIDRIKKISIYDIIVSVTNITYEHLQKKSFHLPFQETGNDADSRHVQVQRSCAAFSTDVMSSSSVVMITSTKLSPQAHGTVALLQGVKNLKCAEKKLFPYACMHYKQSGSCYSLPPIKDSDNCKKSTTLVEKCIVSEPKTYDYFSGSEVSLVLTFLSLFLFVIGCIVILVILVKKHQNAIAQLQQSVKHKKKSLDESSLYVSEWIGKREGIRQVIIRFNAHRKHLTVHLINGQSLRSIDMSNLQMIELQVSTGSGYLHHILIRMAREYDLILQFESEEERSLFIEQFETFLGNIGVGRQRREINIQHLFKDAVTKSDRQKQLEKFFRVVFAQAFSIRHEEDELLHLDSTQAKEIINTELTPYEFAEALSLRPDALFVKQMFALVDADGNGYISFREFLNMIIIFAKGGPEDKIKLMFDMYDIDHSGKLTRQEFSSMIRSLLELANQSLLPEQLDHLVGSMFKAAGLQNKQELRFEDFSHLLADHREELGYVQLSFDVGSGFKAAPSSGIRHSVVSRAHETVVRAYSTFGGNQNVRENKVKSHIRVETKPEVYEMDLKKQKVNNVIRFIENYKLHIFWGTLYTLVIFGIFIERSYYYSVEREHTGLRRIAGYGVTVTRGAASVMMFAFSTILLTMCRNTITFLRETFLHKFIPFDAAISFHKYIAFWALIFTSMHAIGHGINFYHISTQTLPDLQCLFRDFHLLPKKMPKFHYWCFQTITGITGVFLVIIMALMYVFAVQYARRHVFNAFWKTHNLYPLLYLLMILHGMGRLIQDPIFYYFFLGPVILFTLDRLISVNRKKVEISVLKAELLPSGVTHLEFKRPANFEYRSGQWVRIACVALNGNEYHPFTLSSAPHEENLSLHIRAIGPWTSNLRSVYDPNNLQQHAYPKIYLDGPYGEGHQDWFRYEVSVLVGGGIGITPFASILKDVVFKSSVKTQITCKKLYFIWVTRTQKHFEWMTDIIREVEENDKRKLVDVHIFITQFYQKFDLRTTMLYICERHFQRVSGRSLFTGLCSVTHFGRPDFKVFFESLQHEHPDVGKIAVFSCGPPPMTRNVQLACEDLNKHEGAIFIHHFENF